MPRETVKSSLRLSVSDEPLFAERPEKSASRRENFCFSHFHSFVLNREPRSRRVILNAGNNRFGPILPETAYCICFTSAFYSS